ncbi:hypothetical protein GOP47_0024468 [Adiantum capillus-veneris]|uniref:Uncharacterized protein n=1 Tax=Adiantum capillus-veneris TaxID=13818 RepID=A0A9D4U2Z2_ADICA|nr:hypothetical protein GOP47_0024468 [Adiantum capillus-veneris]
MRPTYQECNKKLRDKEGTVLNPKGNAKVEPPTTQVSMSPARFLLVFPCASLVLRLRLHGRRVIKNACFMFYNSSFPAPSLSPCFFSRAFASYRAIDSPLSLDNPSRHLLYA